MIWTKVRKLEELIRMFKKSEGELREIRESKRFMGVFAALGTVALVVLGIYLSLQLTWPKTTGTVTATEIESFHKESTVKERSYSDLHNAYEKKGQKKTHRKRMEYVLKVDYSFKVGDQSYEGRDSGGRSEKEETVRALVKDKFENGSSIEVAYNPQNPKDSTIHPGWGGNFIFIWILAAGVGFLSFKLITIKEPEKIQPEDY